MRVCVGRSNIIRSVCKYFFLWIFFLVDAVVDVNVDVHMLTVFVFVSGLVMHGVM